MSKLMADQLLLRTTPLVDYMYTQLGLESYRLDNVDGQLSTLFSTYSSPQRSASSCRQEDYV